MSIRALLVAAAFAVSIAPIATFADPAQSGDTAQAGSSGDEIVCKSSPPPTGSRLGGGRECHSQREWDAREKEAQKQLQDKQMHGLQSCIGSCGG